MPQRRESARHGVVVVLAGEISEGEDSVEHPAQSLARSRLSFQGERPFTHARIRLSQQGWNEANYYNVIFRTLHFLQVVNDKTKRTIKNKRRRLIK